MAIPDNKIQFPKFAGLALTSLCILMLELTLTRIFSVTMWYHFAFVAISVALFGISASGLMVFLFENAFPRERLDRQLPLFSSLMALSVVVALVVILRTPFFPRFSLAGLVMCGIIYGTITIPFFLGGICISLLLWHHAERVSGLYFSDLLGAALGCLATLVALNTFTGPQVVLLAAVIAGGASICFAITCDRRPVTVGSGLVFVLVLALFLFNRSDFLTRLWIVKHPLEAGQTREKNIIFEKWNSFSRVTVSPVENQPIFGWGLSATFDGYQPPQMAMVIDAAAGTQLIGFDGDLSKVEFLKYDLTFWVHWLKERAKVLIIGPGGGRDVLAALAFGQRPVVGVEINPIIVNAVRNEFGNFVGNVYQRPEVEIHIDEGRSFLSRRKEKYDIIQASFVDTWAATSSGAFVLTENNLYTLEAFEEYFKHLEDDGMLTFSRWYYEHAPGEALRLAALGVESLERIGCARPRPHFLLAKKSYWLTEGPDGIGTIILKKSPFSREELDRAREVCRRLNFQIVCSPDSVGDPIFERLFDKSRREELYREYPLNVVPPTDDKPFFFHMARIRRVLSNEIEQGRTKYNVKAVAVLANLLVVITTLALVFLILPLFLFRSLKPRELIRHWRYLLYFVLIGFGFIALEIPLIQRFTLFLGHPIYSLAVVLCSLLLFSSLGSLFTRRASAADARSFLIKALLSLTLVLLLYLVLLPYLVHALISLPTYLKVLISLALIAPSGWLMGMPFPLGIKLTSENAQFLVPWCWSVNGAFSVLASVASIAIAINFGFSVTMALGGAAYLAVLIMLVLSRLR
ncbi:MAG: hypothetical protein JSV16_08065 [Candidatus Hydrogenedentota bacterium]|nr:MAG: hypothetical protein JSV16_08065 [Candidatus Hydrogenedentota bacterium]